MGFGTLFFGYFLLLNNVSYFGFTDPIAAVVMLLGFYKLSGVNRYFRYSCLTAGVFSLFSVAELIFTALDLFAPSSALTAALPYLSMGRSVLIATLTVTMLEGIRQVAVEVELEGLPKRCRTMIPVTVAAYTLMILMDTPPLLSAMPKEMFAVLTMVILIGIPVTVIINLYSIFTAYARICMPDEAEGKERASRFGFVNEYRRRKQEKDREYAEYKIGKAKARSKSRKGGKK